MKKSTSDIPKTDPPPVEGLTEQRTRLQQWLSRLDEVGAEVPAHVTERVRGDYISRLKEVTAELASHRESIAEDLGLRRAELTAAEDALVGTRDVLQETRLRQRIGEIVEDDWESRRPALEDAVVSAEGDRDRLREEVERLEALVNELKESGEPPQADLGLDRAEGGGESWSEAAGAAWEPDLSEAAPGDDTIPEWHVPAPAAKQAPADLSPDPESVVNDGEVEKEEVEGVDLSWLKEIENTAQTAPPAASAEETSVEDIAFLEELDRAITAPEAGGGGDGERTLDADRAGMLLCKECGAINEPQSWYCEVCGSEL